MLYLKAWACLQNPPNLLDLAIKKKNNYKAKSSGSQTGRKRKVSLPALLDIAEAVRHKLRKLND